MSSVAGPARMTLDDLARFDGNAELIGGKIVPQMATGHLPNIIAGRIYRKLADFVDEQGWGFVYTDNMGFAVAELPSGRESFSPDVSYYAGTAPANPMKFVRDAPTIAMEVRSENDYGPAAEREVAAKRADYFAAGTALVWDVDPVMMVIRAYRPDQFRIFKVGQEADVEPILPRWRLNLARVFA